MMPYQISPAKRSGSTRQVVPVMADITLNGSGAGTVQIGVATRWAQTNGSAVVWDKPTALFRPASATAFGLERRVGLDGGLGLDMVESWDA